MGPDDNGAWQHRELIDDGFGGHMAYDLVPPERILVPCLNAKNCGHNHPEPVEYTGPSLEEIADDAIQTLADVLDDVTGGVKDYSGHQEQLAYLKQALKEWRDADDGDS